MMENSASNPTSSTPVPSIDQPILPIPKPTQPVKKASRFSIKAIIGTIIFLLLAGGAAASFVYKESLIKLVSLKPQSKIISITPSPSDDPTKNWKSFDSDFGGFSMKFPENFNLASQSSQTVNHSITNKPFTTHTIKMSTANNSRFEIIITENNNFKDNNDYQEFIVGRWKSPSQTQITIGELNSIFVTGPNGVGEPLWNTNASIFRNGKTYEFTLLSPEKLGKQENLFRQIINTFKFTEPNTSDTNDWITYENALFSFSHPRNWVLQEDIPQERGKIVRFHSSDYEDDGGRPNITKGFVAILKYQTGCVKDLVVLNGPTPIGIYNIKNIGPDQNSYLIEQGWEGLSYIFIPDKTVDLCLAMAVPSTMGTLTPFENSTLKQYQQDFLSAASSFKVK